MIVFRPFFFSPYHHEITDRNGTKQVRREILHDIITVASFGADTGEHEMHNGDGECEKSTSKHEEEDSDRVDGTDDHRHKVADSLEYAKLKQLSSK